MVELINLELVTGLMDVEATVVRKATDEYRLPSDAVLLRMCRSGWAWEWLRHNPKYQTNRDTRSFVHRRVERTDPLLTVIELKRPHSQQWGLCFAEHAERPYHRAAVFWSPRVDPTVCPVSAVPVRFDGELGVLDLTRVKVAATVLLLPTGEQHLLLCDGVHSIQLHVVQGSVLNGPVRLAHVLGEFHRLQEHTLTIERLGVVLKKGRFPAGLIAPEPNAERWLLTLKAIDMEAAGLSHAEIAAKLYDGSGHTGGFATDWRRSRVRRLLDSGRILINGDYLKILERAPKPGWQAA